MRRLLLLVIMLAGPGSVLADGPAPRDATPWQGEPKQIRRAPATDLRNAWQWWCATVDRAKLAPWERQWLGRTPQRTVTVWRTFYGPWDRGRYKGAPWHIAANPQHLKPGTVVWLARDRRLVVVTNRGANSNDRAARGHGAAHWVDLWSAAPRGDNATQTAYIIGHVPWPH